MFSNRHPRCSIILCLIHNTVISSPGGDTCVRVCRWVKWTSMVKCCVHSLTSRGLVTCHCTVKVTCLSLTVTIIAFYCWAVNCNYNASSLTQTLKSSCGGQHDYVTTNSHHNSMLYTAVRSGHGGRCGGHLTSSQCFVCDEFWLWLITAHYTYIERCWYIQHW